MHDSKYASSLSIRTVKKACVYKKIYERLRTDREQVVEFACMRMPERIGVEIFIVSPFVYLIWFVMTFCAF